VNPAAIIALMWFYIGNGKGDKNMVVLPYKDRSHLSSEYPEQLAIESPAKEFDLDRKGVNQSIAVFWNNGLTYQNSYVQQLIDCYINSL
jgi:glucose-6-phosphate isomerase